MLPILPKEVCWFSLLFQLSFSSPYTRSIIRQFNKYLVLFRKLLEFHAANIRINISRTLCFLLLRFAFVRCEEVVFIGMINFPSIIQTDHFHARFSVRAKSITFKMIAHNTTQKSWLIIILKWFSHSLKKTRKWKPVYQQAFVQYVSVCYM